MDRSIEGSRPTRRWLGTGALALVSLAVGVVTRSPAILLAAVVVVGVVAYGRTSTAPPLDLAVERTVDDPRPGAGEEVAVTLRIRNESAEFLPDLRIVDGVPATLRVESGSPRVATALRPGETATVSYTVLARRGVHEFGPTMALCRDLAAAAERVRYVDASGSDEEGAAHTLVCRPRYRGTVAPVPLRRNPALGSGPVTTDTGGSGVEFYATREYRPGDPLNRVDWNRLARTGTVATTEFREERVATVLFVADARESAYCSPEADEHAVDRIADAVGRMGVRLLDDGHRVGLATLGPGDCWLAPGAGRDQATRLRNLLSTHESLSPLPDHGSERPGRSRPATGVSGLGPNPREPQRHAESEWVRRLGQRLPRDVQLIVCTPLVDEASARILRGLAARGYPVTAVSPDPTASETSAQAIARIGRRFRITDLRGEGIPIVDWKWADSLDASLERYAEVDG